MKIAKFSSKKWAELILIVQFFTYIQVSSEYVSEGDPPCRESCENLIGDEKTECLKEYMQFYSYKLINSMFNYGKISIFAGLWASRYEKPDLELFKNVFQKNLNLYKNPEILGSLNFDDLNKTANFIFSQFEMFTKQKAEDELIPYDAYPSLRCPTPCTNELLTWKTLFGLSVAIFVLSLITISLYSIFLRKQYAALKTRLKNIKYSKVNTDQIEK